MYIFLRNTPINLIQLADMGTIMVGRTNKKYLQFFPTGKRPACYFVGDTKCTHFESLVSELDVLTAFNRYRLLHNMGITNQDETAALLGESPNVANN